MSNLTVFKFQDNQVRVIDIDGNPWFVAKDVLGAICSTTTVTALESLIKEGLGDEFVTNQPILDSLGRTQKTLILAEAAVTFFVSRSRTELGKAMNRWIHSEVLPSIRKTGKYEIQPTPQVQAIALLAQQAAEFAKYLTEQAQRQEELAKRIESVEIEQGRFSSPSGNKYSILGFALNQGLQISASEASAKGRRASALCRELGIKIDRINDPRFGKVGLYPENILIQVFS